MSTSANASGPLGNPDNTNNADHAAHTRTVSRRPIIWTVVAVAIMVGLAAIALPITQTTLQPSVSAPTTGQPGGTRTATPPSDEAGNRVYPSDKAKPDLVAILSGYASLWKSSGRDDLQGVVRDATVLRWNDRVASWVNQHASRHQQFRALQDAQYLREDGSGYDQSFTTADGLGDRVGALYLAGRLTGRLPRTSALLNNSTGTVGNYVSVGRPKVEFSYPRPFLSADPEARSVPGNSCKPSEVNASALVGLRKNQPWADAWGNLTITRVPAAVDATKRFTNRTVGLDGAYDYSGLCQAGSFPSGHSADAYASGVMLATMLPELAPSILARASEAANNRVVLGVHYPLDVIGGRMSGQAAVAARWADPAFRGGVILPAREELIGYLESACGSKLATCIASDTPYRNDPYAGATAPGGTSQEVSDRSSALAVYTERLGYGFRADGSPDDSALPIGAESLLITAFPSLSDAQRRAVLAQTAVRAGHPLDTRQAHADGKARGSWQRLNLAAAMSATVLLQPDGTARVIGLGDVPTVRPG